MRGIELVVLVELSVSPRVWRLSYGQVEIELIFCIALDLQAVEIKLDAKIIVDLLNGHDLANNRNATIVADCRESLRRIPKVRISHCYKEANKCVDALTRRGVHLIKLRILLCILSLHLMCIFFLIWTVLVCCMLYERLVPSNGD